MGFPSREEIDRVLKELENIEPSYDLPPQASIGEKFKYQLCQELIGYSNRKKLSRVKLAKLLKISQKKTTDALKCKIWLFTVDDLIELLVKIKPKTKIIIS